MKQKPFFTAAALLLPTILLHAQYLGGMGDGHEHRYAQVSVLSGVPFHGGSGDGFDGKQMTTSTLANVFRGGGNDGFNSQHLQTTTLASVFRGGPADGFDSRQMTTSTLASIFRGGANDGHGSLAVTINTVALGVELLSFNGHWLGEHDAFLQWKVANEGNLLHYELERSLGGEDGFELIAVLPPTVGDVAEKTYHFTDYEAANLGSRYLYYRLKSVDLDGQSAYSAVAVLEVAAKGHAVSIYPNPTAHSLTIAFSEELLDGQPLRALLFDPAGKLLRTWELDSPRLETDLSGLPSASYRLVLLQGTEAIHSANIIKQ